MKVTFWGVRGSVPAPGPETNRYGGNTSCVELRTANGELNILDMGTGAVLLGRQLMQGDFGKGLGNGRIFLSHQHWDHIQGFPFCAPIFVRGNTFTIYGPARSPGMLEGMLEGQMDPNFSPLYTMRNLGATFDFIAVDGGSEERTLDCGQMRVSARLNPHGPTKALAYRFEADGKVLVYAPDCGYPPSGPSPEVRAVYHGADVLIHDCTYSPEDRAERLSRGYSSIADAVDAAIQGAVKRLVMFHYDQDYGDDAVDTLATRTRQLLDERGGKSIALTAASEGLTVDV